MRILIIHISDFHIRTDLSFDGEARFLQMRRSLGSLDEYRAILVLFTGDAAFSGQAEEYDRVELLFAKMVDVLSEGYDGEVVTLVVPGNHDLYSPEDVAIKEAELLEGKPSWSTMGGIARDQLARMANYNTWASGRGCAFDDSQVITKEVTIGEGGSKAMLRFTLINTVPVSNRMSSTDKQYHFIDEVSISRIAYEKDNDLHIALAHHNPEWFADDMMRPLSDMLRSYADILLFGHDHVVGSYEHVEDDKSTMVLPGGKSDFAPGGEFTFTSIDLDMGKYPYEAHIVAHKWKQQSQRFDDEGKPVRSILPKRGAPTPSPEFLDMIGTVSGNTLLSAPFMEYFVFPPLVGSTDLDTCESDRIDDFEGFFKVLECENCVCVKGGGNSGKTTFARAIYLRSMREGYVPILLSPDESQPSVRVMLKNLVEGQYGDSDDAADRFRRLDKSRKLLVIDDFDRLHKKKTDSQYLAELLAHVGTIVLISRDEPELDAAESVKRQLGFEGSSIVFTMGPFVKSKRDKLVRNICEIEGAGVDTQSRLTNVVDHVISNHQSMFDMSPDFIIHYAKYLLAHPEAMSANDVVPMGQLYEANIEEAVRKTLSRGGWGERARFSQTIMVLLEEIAYEMHVRKTPAISQERVSGIVTDYCYEHVLDLDLNVFIDTVRQSRIMAVGPDGRLRFCSINQLAFFTAKRLQRNSPQTSLGDELEYLLDNICFEINERILLFLAYLRDNSELPYELCDRLNSMLYSEAEFDLGSQAFAFLAEPMGSEMSVAKREDDDRRSRIADENEAQLARREPFEYSDVYDYDESEVWRSGYTMIKALKYIQMLGRSYIAQYVHTDRTTKEFIRESLFEGSSRILGKTMDRLSGHFEEIVDALYEDLEEVAADDPNAQPFDRYDVAKFLRTFSCVLCVSVYDSIAYSCAESDTVRFLCDYDRDDSSSRVLKVCMQENALDSREFVDIICAAGASAKTQGLEKTLLRLIANKHIVTHPSISHRDIDRISQQLFGSNAAKKGYLAGRINARTSMKNRVDECEARGLV